MTRGRKGGGKSAESSPSTKKTCSEDTESSREKSKSPAKGGTKSPAKKASPAKSVESTTPTRTSGRAKKTLDYNALNNPGTKKPVVKKEKDDDDEMKGIEIFLMEADGDNLEAAAAAAASSKKRKTSGGETKTKSPRPKKVQRLAEDADVTEGRCGKCAGCRKAVCNECSHCKNNDHGNCIDTYCTNQREGRSQREAAKELYLMSLGKIHTPEKDMLVEEGDEDDEQEEEEEREVEEGKDDEFKRDKKLTINQQVDLMMAKLGALQKNRKGLNKDSTTTVQQRAPTRPAEPRVRVEKPKKPRNKPKMMAVYGGSSKAAKMRRCGECEGCTRDDCGECQACADKPRFGGKGTKKKACLERYCRMKQNDKDRTVVQSDPNPSLALQLPNVQIVGVVNNAEEDEEEEEEAGGDPIQTAS